jgi:hypothetical protein
MIRCAASPPVWHRSTRITEEYTVVQFDRQEQTTRRIQKNRRRAARRNDGKVIEINRNDSAA